ncbi:hypothetical protein CEE69_12280 [Rhodopirellula bahusiensis]|uniref:Uncharacterized protein n=1 Tax=Rhodopirellula bahusiensis TaxID=2014065 RepID=A0A2G1W842_9BACT|nr:hypothetical protein CEE69_12280 [Rhodopirellula bahusiensis]
MNQRDINGIVREHSRRNTEAANVQKRIDTDRQLAMQRYANRHAFRNTLSGIITESIRADFQLRVHSIVSQHQQHR